MRKIIQLSDSKVLCDDGTMWTLSYASIEDQSFENMYWRQLPDIPQDKEESE